MIASNWSPDSQRLLVWTPTLRDAGYLLALEEPWSDSPRQVRYDLDVEFLERYPHHVGGYYSPDGRWIVFPAYAQRHRPVLFLLRVGETRPRELWEGSGFPHWLADPGRVHLYSEREGTVNGPFGFVPVDPDTGERLGDFVPLLIQPSPHGYTRDLTHSMTPDRRWLYFQFVEQEGDVYVADLDWR